MEKYLRATDIIDWRHPDILDLAKTLSQNAVDESSIVRRCFEWVRDEIRHSYDHRVNPVTCKASDVLQAKTGYCFAKSHLLAALLRANTIPAGLCYQRLSKNDQGAPFCLHGLTAVHLKAFGWYRLDPRGNKPGVDARYEPPAERLAFTPALTGERDFAMVLSDPLGIVIEVLNRYQDWKQVYENLPDVDLLAL